MTDGGASGYAPGFLFHPRAARILPPRRGKQKAAQGKGVVAVRKDRLLPWVQSQRALLPRLWRREGRGLGGSVWMHPSNERSSLAFKSVSAT